jgi:hypothetical protein
MLSVFQPAKAGFTKVLHFAWASTCDAHLQEGEDVVVLVPCSNMAWAKGMAVSTQQYMFPKRYLLTE